MRSIILRIFSVFFLFLLFNINGVLAEKKQNIHRKDIKGIETDVGDRWLAWDKFLHLTASAGITGLSYHFYHCQFNNPQEKSIYFSISVAGASGIGKEFIDKNFRKTGWSWKDLTADAAGIVAGYFLFIKLKK